MIQTSLLTERIRRIEPNPQSSADSPGIGVAFSGQKYVVKVATPQHPYLPATEWLCHGLALKVDLPVPFWCVCMLPGDVEAFGSRMEGAVVAMQFIPSTNPSFDNPEVLSHTLALDMFLGNDDRHPYNWLVTDTAGSTLLRPIDFSRALLWRWLPTLPPWLPVSNSHKYYQLASMVGALDRAETLKTLTKIAQLPKHSWINIVESVPDTWLTVSMRKELINWWWSPIWHTRIKWIEAQL